MGAEQLGESKILVLMIWFILILKTDFWVPSSIKFAALARTRTYEAQEHSFVPYTYVTSLYLPLETEQLKPTTVMNSLIYYTAYYIVKAW